MPRRPLKKRTKLVRTVTVSAKGQIVLPAEIREIHGVSEGDELVIVSDGERILIEPESRVVEALADEFDYLTAAAERSLKELWDNDADEIWDHYA